MAGLRTYALGAAGATSFVSYPVATPDSIPTRVASYVVSGIGFLGGVILRVLDNRTRYDLKSN